jgi:hypothetical protein
MIARVATSRDAKEWWAGLPDNTRRAVIQKTLNALAKAELPRDIGTLTRALVAMDKLDFERERLERGHGGTTINVSGNMNVADLRGMTAEQLKAAKIKMLNERTDDSV